MQMSKNGKKNKYSLSGYYKSNALKSIMQVFFKVFFKAVKKTTLNFVFQKIQHTY
jgi:hypothetical protein